MEPRYLLKEGRHFKIARIGKDGLLEKTDKEVSPLGLAHFGSEVISIPVIDSHAALKSFYEIALIRAKNAGADFVTGNPNNSTKDTYSEEISSIGVINFYLANFPLPAE